VARAMTVGSVPFGWRERASSQKTIERVFRSFHDSRFFVINDGSIVIKAPMSYIVSGHLQLLGYLAPTASDPILIATDDIGLISESPFTASEIQKYTNMINMPVFAVWAVPPQGMNNGGSTNIWSRTGNRRGHRRGNC
jgi:hypothetical protein